MNRLKIKYAVAYGFLAATAVVLIASLFAGCHVYEHEEVEIIRCPVNRNRYRLYPGLGLNIILFLILKEPCHEFLIFSAVCWAARFQRVFSLR